MRVCPFLIIIYTGVSSGSNMSYEPEPERYDWKTVSGKRLPFSLIRIMLLLSGRLLLRHCQICRGLHSAKK